MPPNPIYYECHITLEPVEEKRLQIFNSICNHYLFKPATLLMQKTLDKNKLDSFCTSKAADYVELEQRMYAALKQLKNNNFKIYRYKIEAIVLDERIKNG